MQQDRMADIERGMQLVPQVPEIMPDQAQAEIAALYEETRQVLRVPFVNFIFRILAQHPDFLLPEWRRLRPWAQSLDFERAADALRRAAQASPAPEQDAALGAMEGMDQVRPFTASIHYVLPKLLLLATAMDLGLDPAPDAGAAAFGPAMPAGVAAGTLSLPMQPASPEDPRLQALFRRIRSGHGHPGVATYYRVLANWPDILDAAWARIEPRLGAEEYSARREAVLAQAEAALPALPSASRPPLAPALAADLRALLAVFRFRVVADLLLDVSLLRAMLDGPAAARESRFSLA